MSGYLNLSLKKKKKITNSIVKILKNLKSTSLIIILLLRVHRNLKQVSWFILYYFNNLSYIYIYIYIIKVGSYTSYWQYMI